MSSAFICLPVAAPLDADAVCRWCRWPLLLNPDGQFVGFDDQELCYANTAGCGQTCGFQCRCEGRGWLHGSHEPMAEDLT